MKNTMNLLEENELYEIEGGMLVASYDPSVGAVNDIGEKNTTALLRPWF